MDKEVHAETSFQVWRRMLTELVLLSSVTACISFTVTDSAVFRPFRDWVKSKSKFLGELFQCGFCFGFWVALPMDLFMQPVFSTCIALDYFMVTFVIAWLSGFQWVIMCCLMKHAGK